MEVSVVLHATNADYSIPVQSTRSEAWCSLPFVMQDFTWVVSLMERSSCILGSGHLTGELHQELFNGASGSDREPQQLQLHLAPFAAISLRQ